MVNKVDVFYTGGGITLAEVDLSENRYAVVSTDAPEYLTIYAYTDGEKTYLPEDMISSVSITEMALETKALYDKMLSKLKTA